MRSSECARETGHRDHLGIRRERKRWPERLRREQNHTGRRFGDLNLTMKTKEYRDECIE